MTLEEANKIAARIQTPDDPAKILLATAFGAQFGWRWKPEIRGLEHLHGRNPRKWTTPPCNDHASSYHQGGLCVALVAQPYANVPGVEEMREWAHANGLSFTLPDWPSWHFPGRSTLCLFTLRANDPSLTHPDLCPRPQHSIVTATDFFWTPREAALEYNISIQEVLRRAECGERGWSFTAYGINPDIERWHDYIMNGPKKNAP